MERIDQCIARGLGIDEGRITDGLQYQSITEWDSLGHVSLMAALESDLGIEIDDDLMLGLRTVADIRRFARGSRPTPPQPPPAGRPTVHRGLEGVYFDRTTITRSDATEGVLEHRGYDIHDLAESASYEEVARLLVKGELPDRSGLEAFREELVSHREPPPRVLDLARSLAHAHPMEALRTCVSALGAFGPVREGGRDETFDEALRTGIALVAQVPTLVAAHHAARTGRERGVPAPDTSHAASFLTALQGREPTPAEVRIMNQAFVLHADFGPNPAALAARVSISCRAGMTAAITSAIAAFAGSRHGGAAERALRLVDEVGTPQNAERYVRDLQKRKEPVMGFGHRVFRTEDPRARHFRAIVQELSQEKGDTHGLEVLDAVVAAMRPYRRHGVAPNVDLYSGLAYRLMGLPDDLAAALFVIGRTAGWVAQCLEQHSHNVLIVPLLEYVGPAPRTYRRPEPGRWNRRLPPRR
ncbi:citrate/2-methylcitrate synthase [Streptomyces roseolus]|uniref:citrate/2-methylcitrate synthase n=1 Tax=Streptomyces roseolus TaxID=67358 RepID=UPI0036465687